MAQSGKGDNTVIAIILVNYNGAEDTIECIGSLSENRDIEYEIIVVDNCSTDNSVGKLKQAQNYFVFTLLQAKNNDGFSAGNNIGIRYAKNADFYLLLNNDTVVEPDFLKKLIDGFQEDPRCGATISKIRYCSHPDTIWYAGGKLNPKTARSEHFHFNEKDQNTDILPQAVTFASGCCLCLSREVVEKVGLLNEDFFLYEEDAEYCCRIIKADYKIFYIPNSVIYHKVSSSTGNGSPMSQYYSVRNRYHLIRLQFAGINKLLAYSYCTLQFIYRCLKGKIRFRYYRMGLLSFFRGEIGRAKGEIV